MNLTVLLDPTVVGPTFGFKKVLSYRGCLIGTLTLFVINYLNPSHLFTKLAPIA